MRNILFYVGLVVCIAVKGVQGGNISQAIDYMWQDANGPNQASFAPFDSRGGTRILQAVFVEYAGDMKMTVTVQNYDATEYFANDWQVDAYLSVLVGFAPTPGFDDGGPFYFLGGISNEGVTGYLSPGNGGGPR